MGQNFVVSFRKLTDEIKRICFTVGVNSFFNISLLKSGPELPQVCGKLRVFCGQSNSERVLQAMQTRGKGEI